MFNYQNLESEQFEKLCRDIMQVKTGTELHVFARGRDGGVDLTDDSDKHNIVVQVKHYEKSGFTTLKNNLEKEVEKVKKLNPKQYYVCVSQSLTDSNVNTIYQMFSDSMESTNNILTLDDIDSFLHDPENIQITRNHTKLWLESGMTLQLLLECFPFIRTQYNNGSALGQNNIDNMEDSNTSALTLIDRMYIDAHKVDASQYERCRFDYYVASRSFDSVFKAVINNISATSHEYEYICDRIYNSIKYNTVLIVMAEGGTGKSTLLARIAVRLAEENNIVFYSDDIECPNMNQIRELTRRIYQDVFFLIDNASKNLTLISYLYSLTESNRFVHVIICDRIYRISSLIADLDISGWLYYGKAIVLKNGNTTYVTPIRKNNTEEILLSIELRRTLAEEAINSVIDIEDLDIGTCEEVKKGLTFENHSITDIVLDFCVNYNLSAQRKLHHPKIIRLDWDEWDDVPQLKGSFMYLAALTLYGVNVTTLQMQRITGVFIEELVTDGRLQVIRLQNGVIRLKHDTVADNFFKVKHINPVDVIEVLLDKRLLTENIVLEFEKKSLSLTNIYSINTEIKKLQIPKLVLKFSRIMEYRRLLESKQRIHSLELALIVVNGKNSQEDGRYYRLKIGESFDKIKAFYSKQERLWIKYFFFAVYHADSIPEELLLPLRLEGLYKKATKSINGYIRNNFRNLSTDERNQWIRSLEQLLQWIISNINQNDVPSRILLLWVYNHSGRTEKAKNIVYELSGLKESELSISEMSVVYIQTYENEVRQLVKKDRNDPKIRKTNTFIYYYYKDLINNTTEAADEYVTIIRSYIRFRKDTGHFDEAYSVGIETIDKLAEKNIALYRIYIELGMICQFRRQRNNHFNLEEAIYWFKRAIEEIDSSSRKLLYAMKPLCKTYLYIGDYLECLSICKQIKTIDFRDKEVMNIKYEAIRLQQIKELMLPVGNQYKPEDAPKPEQVEEYFELLINGMTVEQQAFAELFQLRDLKNRFSAYRVAFSIKNNLYIPSSILYNLPISSPKKIELLIGDRFS